MSLAMFTTKRRWADERFSLFLLILSCYVLWCVLLGSKNARISAVHQSPDGSILVRRSVQWALRTSKSQVSNASLSSVYRCFLVGPICDNVTYMNYIKKTESTDQIQRVIYENRKDMIESREYRPHVFLPIWVDWVLCVSLFVMSAESWLDCIQRQANPQTYSRWQ